MCRALPHPLAPLALDARLAQSLYQHRFAGSNCALLNVSVSQLPSFDHTILDDMTPGATNKADPSARVTRSAAKHQNSSSRDTPKKAPSSTSIPVARARTNSRKTSSMRTRSPP